MRALSTIKSIYRQISQSDAQCTFSGVVVQRPDTIGTMYLPLPSSIVYACKILWLLCLIYLLPPFVVSVYGHNGNKAQSGRDKRQWRARPGLSLLTTEAPIGVN